MTALTIGQSDHKLLSSVRYAKVVEVGQQYVCKRSYKKFEESKFLEAVKKIRWWQIYKCDNVDAAVKLFTSILTSILDRPDMAPVRRIQRRRHYAGWLSEETKQLMVKRDEAMVKFTTTRLQEDWESARALRNIVVRRLKSEKSNYAREKVRKCEEEQDSARVWSNIRSYIGWGGTSGAPTRLTDTAGQLVTSPAAMAELQNQFYIEKVQKIRAQLPRQGDPTATLRRAMAARPRPRPADLALASVTPETINRTIQKLKNSKSCGNDDIDTYILKLARPYIVPAVTHIANLSISTLSFPSAFKVAKVVPLYKGRDSPVTEPKSYRPVALLPVLSKVLERVVHSQLMGYMEQHQLVHPQQHAYRSRHSTTSAMLAMHDAWVEAAEHGMLAGVTMIDMSAAFDVVDVQLLLEKCRLYGFSREAEQWLWSYLVGRSQYTTIAGSTSSTLPLVAGVPQGSILGPLLYTIFTSDFPEVVHGEDCPHGPLHRQPGELAGYRTMCTECGGVVCFADDSTNTVFANTEAELSGRMTRKYRIMADYLTENRLCINSAKTHTMVICTKQRRRNIDTMAVTLDTGSEVITPSPAEQLLGVTVHQDLSFAPLLLTGKDSILSSLTLRISALKKVGSISSFNTRLSVCSSLVVSKILYMLPLYAGAPEYMLTGLQLAMRVVTRRRWEVVGRRLTSTATLLRYCGYLSVRQMAYYHSVASVHKVLLHEAPVYLHQVLSTSLASGVHHRYPTSAAGRRQVAPARLAVADTSWRWRAAREYADLPAVLRTEASLPRFLAGLRKHAIQHVDI